MWCVHEVNEARHYDIDMRGLFHADSWSAADFQAKIEHCDTEKSKTSSEADRRMLVAKILKWSGGFAQLDEEIKAFRAEMLVDLKAALQFEQLFGIDLAELVAIGDDGEGQSRRGKAAVHPEP